MRSYTAARQLYIWPGEVSLLSPHSAPAEGARSGRRSKRRSQEWQKEPGVAAGARSGSRSQEWQQEQGAGEEIRRTDLLILDQFVHDHWKCSVQEEPR